MYAEGNYVIRISGQNVSKSSNGNTQLALDFYPTQHEKEPLTNPARRTLFLTLTKDTIGTPDKPGWVVVTLKQMGFAGTSFRQLDPNQPDAHSFVDQQFPAYCKHDEYQGKPREKWSVSKPKKAEAASQSDLDALDSSFAAVLASKKVQIGGPIAATDDTPF